MYCRGGCGALIFVPRGGKPYCPGCQATCNGTEAPAGSTGDQERSNHDHS